MPHSCCPVRNRQMSATHSVSVGARPACGTDAKSQRAIGIGNPGTPLHDVSHAGDICRCWCNATRARSGLIPASGKCCIRFPISCGQRKKSENRLPTAGYKRRLESVTFGKVPIYLETVSRARKAAVVGGP